MDSPTKRSLKAMRDKGYTCQVVEKWNPFAKIRQDLFGFIDIVCIREGETVGVQTTTKAHMGDRRKKILAHANYDIVKLAGWNIMIHGWVKNKKNRYELTEEPV